MKKILTAFFVILLSYSISFASDQGYDMYKGSASMYDVSDEMTVLKEIESNTDPETEKVNIGDLSLNFEFIEHGLAQEDGLQVAYVHFSDKKDEYILTYHVKGDSVVKIILFSKNGEYINKKLYPAEDPEKKDCSEGNKESK